MQLHFLATILHCKYRGRKFHPDHVSIAQCIVAIINSDALQDLLTFIQVTESLEGLFYTRLIFQTMTKQQFGGWILSRLEWKCVRTHVSLQSGTYLYQLVLDALKECSQTLNLFKANSVIGLVFRMQQNRSQNCVRMLWSKDKIELRISLEVAPDISLTWLFEF